MITIFMGAGYVPPKTFIFVPGQCPKTRSKGHVYISGGGKHAEDRMVGECGLVNEFYLTSSPCPDCAMELYGVYHSHAKPTINIARYYQGKGKTKKGSKDGNKLCLAMLVQAGFRLETWDWKDLSQLLTNQACKTSISTMVSAKNRSQETENVLNEVKQMARSKTNYHTECNNVLNG